MSHCTLAFTFACCMFEVSDMIENDKERYKKEERKLVSSFTMGVGGASKAFIEPDCIEWIKEGKRGKMKEGVVKGCKK